MSFFAFVMSSTVAGIPAPGEGADSGGVFFVVIGFGYLPASECRGERRGCASCSIVSSR